jgi:[protein-PII] uridylyltransferase
VTPAVFIDNQVSSDASVIEINARDRLGLLYDILGGMQECGMQVMSASLATYGTKAVDVFYVKDAYGHKITHPAKLSDVQRQLLAVCAAPLQNVS